MEVGPVGRVRADGQRMLQEGDGLSMGSQSGSPLGGAAEGHPRLSRQGVRFGPIRSASQPHTKLMTMATRVSDSSTYTLWFSVSPNTFTVTTLITTMTVFTASE